MQIEFTVNGRPCCIDAPPLRRLLDLLREDLGLTGTKEGCGEGECGACAVLMDGELVHACLVPAIQVAGRSVLTIEGLGTEARPDPVQRAFLEEGAVQCGFCIPGMVMASRALLERSPEPNRSEIREALSGNLCRCTGYERIIRAVERAARNRQVVENRQSRQIPSPDPPRSIDPRRRSTRSRATAPAIGSLPDALRLLTEHVGPLRPLAGGTDLMASLHLDLEAPEAVLDLSRIAELHELQREGDSLSIGAGVTVSRLLDDPLVARHAPALRQAAGLFGAPAIRNRATLGGNLMTASPAADLPPVLLALEAVAILASAQGRRDVALSEFYPAYRRTDRRAGELLLSIRIPIVTASRRQAFFKVGTRRAQSIAKVSLAACVELDPERTIRRPRLAAGSVAPTPILLSATAEWLDGRSLDAATIDEAGRRAAAEVRPIDDVRSSASYRRAVLGRLVRRFLEDQAEAP